MCVTFFVTHFVNTMINYHTGDFLQPLMVGREGYPVETHQVITKDGYILRMHRIPHGKRSPRTDIERPAVYIQHGIESSSADWLVAGPRKALG